MASPFTAGNPVSSIARDGTGPCGAAFQSSGGLSKTHYLVLSLLTLATIAFLHSTAYAQKSIAGEIEDRLQLADKFRQQREVIRATSEFREALGLTMHQLGLIYHALGDLEKAELAYRGAIEAKTDSDDAVLGLAIIYLRKGEFDKGIEAIKSLLSQKPFHPAARHLLGKLYFSMNRFDAAALELEEAARLAPNDYSVFTTLAMAYLKQQRLENARKIFDRILKEVGPSPQLHILFGGAYRETEFINEAAVEFKRAIALDTNYPRVHYFLGLSYLSQGGKSKVDEAVAEFKTELKRDPNDYLTNYLLGLVYLNERQLADAVVFLEKAMALDPGKPDPPLFLGQALFLLGRQKEAVPVLKKAIDLTSDPGRNQYQISNAHYLLSQALRREGKLDEAVVHAELAGEYKAKSATRDVERLQLYLKSGSPGTEEFHSAVESLKGTAVIVEPEPPDEAEKRRLDKIEKVYVGIAANTYNQLGFLSVGNSEFNRAARYFEHAANWDPKIPDVDYNAGLAHFKAGQFQRAAIHLERAHKQQANVVTLRLLLGLSFFFSDNYLRAAELLGPLANEGVDDSQVMFALGLSAAHLGDRRRGEEILRRLLEKHPGAADVHLALGRVRALDSDYTAAAIEFAKALELNPSLPDVYYFIGLSLLRQSKFSEAAAEFRKEIGRNPRHVKAQYHLGFTLASMQQIDEAIKRFEETIRLDPSHGDAYYELGKVRLQQGQSEEAIKVLERAVELIPDKSYSHYQLSLAYSKVGRQEAAQEAMARYRELKAGERGNSQ